ncbi:MAG TPA: tetratricopeptide repeat protein [Bacteroidales bacterium]|jgi:tetratricopeptide (TPR) repeat protein|nr:tetratricopeptide repeat protein [Bacteroidales bacterium]HPE40093.1 tetratricopeptide repeat protein [Bacteroidales bacterium]
MTNKEKIGAKKESITPKKQNFITKTIEFFNTYNKIIYGVIIGILIVISAILAFNKFYLAPKSEKASMLILKPIEKMMAGDSASVLIALEGDEEMDGFLTIAKGYRLTKTANTANYYAGISYLKLNDKEEALNYLLKFKHKEDVLWYACQAIIGDLYDDMGDTKKAISYYEKAVDGDEDPYFTPINLFKLGQMYERDEQWQKAIDLYNTIENDFYDQYTKMGVSRFVDRAKAKIGK